VLQVGVERPSAYRIAEAYSAADDWFGAGGSGRSANWDGSALTGLGDLLPGSREGGARRLRLAARDGAGAGAGTELTKGATLEPWCEGTTVLLEEVETVLVDEAFRDGAGG
jgi:hypothetical protein